MKHFRFLFFFLNSERKEEIAYILEQSSQNER